MRAWAEFDAWGVVRAGQSHDLNLAGLTSSAGFTSYTYDKVLDLHFAQFRFYSADDKRFTAEDPVKDGANWYSYCGNDPVNFVDPLGLVPIPEWAVRILNGWETQVDIQKALTVPYNSYTGAAREPVNDAIAIAESSNKINLKAKADMSTPPDWAIRIVNGWGSQADMQKALTVPYNSYTGAAREPVNDAIAIAESRHHAALQAKAGTSHLPHNTDYFPEVDAYVHQGAGLKISLAGLKLLAEMEVSSNSRYMVKENGELKGIITHDVGDGGLTIGYGFYIKGGMSNTSEINRLKNEYGIIVQEGIAVDIDKVLKLYYESIIAYEDRAKGYINESGINPKQHEFDALVIQAYNGTYYDVMTAFGDESLNDAQALEKTLQTYRTFKTWDVHGNGWTNRLKNIINLYRHGDYTKMY